MSKISPCFKKVFIFFNALFIICGIVIFTLALFLHQIVKEVNGLYGVISLYVIGSLIIAFSVLGAYGTYKESKCLLIVFFILMCLVTAAMLRLAIPVAMYRGEILLSVEEHFKAQVVLTSNMEHAFNPVQQHFKCCGLNIGYQEWQGEIPNSCNCVKPDDTGECKSIATRVRTSIPLTQRQWFEAEAQRVWSKPCGPVLLKIIDKCMTIMMGCLFGLAVLAILASLMSLAMIIRITAPASNQTVSPFSLSYQPPKYSEVVNN